MCRYIHVLDLRLCLVLLFTSMQGQGLMFHYTINLGNIHIQKKMIEKST